jgi:hypothetical protein
VGDVLEDIASALPAEIDLSEAGLSSQRADVGDEVVVEPEELQREGSEWTDVDNRGRPVATIELPRLTSYCRWHDDSNADLHGP